jgi:hypothetical protein
MLTERLAGRRHPRTLRVQAMCGGIGQIRGDGRASVYPKRGTPLTVLGADQRNCAKKLHLWRIVAWRESPQSNCG